MTVPPTAPLVKSWCSDGTTYTVTTRHEPYSCVADQRADHDAAVAALMAQHPANC